MDTTTGRFHEDAPREAAGDGDPSGGRLLARVEIAGTPGGSGKAGAAARRAVRGMGPLAGGLFVLVALLAIGGGLRVVLTGSADLFGWTIGAVLVVAVGWTLVSSLHPASADRKCPECGRLGLVRLDPRSTHGVTCGECGWSDAEQSSFLLAEEEGPLEPIILAERGKQPGERPRENREVT